MEEKNIIIEKEVVITAPKIERIGDSSNKNNFNPSPNEILITTPKIETIEGKNYENGVLDMTLREQEPEKEIQMTKLDVLKRLSSGTGLREGIDNIVNGGMGAIILVENSNTSNIFQGGFKINCKLTSKRLMELAKMDGAIILSEDFKKILFANTLLTPNKTILTNETGTRHQAAERTAKQSGSMVIAVSQRIGKITIYYGNSKYVLQTTEELLRRATETIQILEKQREVFDELIVNLNLLEINNMVSVEDVCSILERLEMIRKMSNIINEYIIELGKDGIILRMRMREIIKGIDRNQDLIIKDYCVRQSKVRQYFEGLSFDNLLDLDSIAKALFAKSLDASVSPRGYRILSKTHLSKEEIELLIRHFKDLENVFSADKETVRRILKDDPEKLQKELNNLREHIVVGKNI